MAFKKISYAGIAALMTLFQASAQDASLIEGNNTDNSAKPVVEKREQDDSTIVTVNGQAVKNLWKGHEADVFGKDGSGRWRYFMHGITDENAQPFAWNTMVPSEYESMLSGIRVRNEVKESEMYSLCLPGKTDIVMARPMVALSELMGRSGMTVRLFVWLKAEDTGTGTDLWSGAPVVSLILKDGNGKELKRTDCQFRTRGSFPWFCYHTEIVLPTSLPMEDSLLGGIFVRLSNPVSGKAWFCCPSWEYVLGPEAEAVSGRPLDSWIDPVRGTFAPNSDYDEMPMNFIYGLGNAEGQKWSFLEGNKQAHGLVLSYDMEKYLELYGKDWLNMTQVIPYLLHVYMTGGQSGRASNFQQDWPVRFINKLTALQDPRTGLWNTGNCGNLYATYLVVTRCFAPVQRVRPGEKAIETPWLAVNGRTVPKAELLVRAVLDAQNTAGNTRAGWNRYAFQGKELHEASRDAVAFDMDSSAAAVGILMQCRDIVPEKLKNEIDDAVSQAYRYAMSHVIDRHWGCYTDETQRAICTSPLAASFFEATAALDTKAGTLSVGTPSVNMAFNEKVIEITVPAVPETISSIRIYGIAPNSGENTFNDSGLIAVLQNGDRLPHEADPLIAIRSISKAMERTADTVKAREAGAFYLAEKLDAMSIVNFATIKANGTVNLPKSIRAAGRKLAVVYADNYGRLSVPQYFQAP